MSSQGLVAASLHRDVDDANLVVGLVGLGVDLDHADVLDHLHALHHPAKHRVLVVQPRLKHTAITRHATGVLSQ